MTLIEEIQKMNSEGFDVSFLSNDERLLHMRIEAINIVRTHRVDVKITNECLKNIIDPEKLILINLKKGKKLIIKEFS